MDNSNNNNTEIITIDVKNTLVSSNSARSFKVRIPLLATGLELKEQLMKIIQTPTQQMKIIFSGKYESFDQINQE
jgi:hypothetical protein